MMHKIVFQVFLESQETSWKYFRHVRTEIETNFLDTHQAQFFGSKIPLIASKLAIFSKNGSESRVLFKNVSKCSTYLQKCLYNDVLMHYR